VDADALLATWFDDAGCKLPVRHVGEIAEAPILGLLVSGPNEPSGREVRPGDGDGDGDGDGAGRRSGGGCVRRDGRHATPGQCPTPTARRVLK